MSLSTSQISPPRHEQGKTELAKLVAAYARIRELEASFCPMQLEENAEKILAEQKLMDKQDEVGAKIRMRRLRCR